jgi:hypothetical protein
VAGQWGLSYKKSFFLFIFGFYVLTRKTSVLAGDFVLAQCRWRALHPPAKTPFTRQHKLFVA